MILFAGYVALTRMATAIFTVVDCLLAAEINATHWGLASLWGAFEQKVGFFVAFCG